jgi:hypothetical protein
MHIGKRRNSKSGTGSDEVDDMFANETHLVILAVEHARIEYIHTGMT